MPSGASRASNSPRSCLASATNMYAVGDSARTPSGRDDPNSRRANSAHRLPERLLGGVDRLGKRLVVVGERREPGLELGGGRVDTQVEHRPAEASVGIRVAGAGAREVA